MEEKTKKDRSAIIQAYETFHVNHNSLIKKRDVIN